MTEKEEKTISKFLSLVLRHQPEMIQLELSQTGWADVDELIEKCAVKNIRFTKNELKQVVQNNNKQRFAYDEENNLIRANQGHSIQIDADLKTAIPPVVLYHGTAEKNVPAIREQGITKQNRLHVHLSADQETANKIGMRHGKPFIFTVEAKQMHDEGNLFYLSENGVWLTELVLPNYLQKDEQ